MMVILLILAILQLGTICTAKPTCHGHAHSCEIETAIQNVDLYFTANLCATIQEFDCTVHVIDQDEQICGTDAVTYDNHCLFSQARCKASAGLHGHQHVTLGVQNHGPCNITGVSSTAIPEVTTTMPNAVSTIQPAATSTGSNSASMAVATSDSPAVMVTSTQLPAITTTNGSTTTDPVGAIVHNVFCKNAPTMNCQGFNIVCGTDGQFYPNDCELLKQACKDPSLTISADFNSCSVTSN